MFRVSTECTEADMKSVINQFNMHEFYSEMSKFLVLQGKYLSEEQLIHMRED